MTRALAIAALLFCSAVHGEVKQEVLQSPVLCGPMRELESLVLMRGAVWVVMGDTSIGRIYYYINEKEGEFYTIKPVGETYCMDFDKITNQRTNRDALLRSLAD